jgi:hypothetical protein
VKRKWYCIFHKKNDDHSSNYCPDKKRFEAILEKKKREKEEQFSQPFRTGLARPKLWEEPFRQPFLATSLSTTYSKLYSTTTLAIPGFLGSKR